MAWEKGQSGNPLGRKPGVSRASGIDRVEAVLQAIQAKAQLQGQAGVTKWLKTLPDETLAQLYSKLLPKDIKLDANVTTSYDDAIRALYETRKRIEGERQNQPSLPSTGVEIVEPGAS